MTVVALEMNFEIILYLITYGIVGIALVFIFKKIYGLNPIILIIIILTSVFPTYISFATIMMTETDTAYSKIKSIPQKNLIEFYNTNDIETIPCDKRQTWIGVRYRRIDIISENRSGNIKAVGWRNHYVFAYYDIDKDDYYASYH